MDLQSTAETALYFALGANVAFALSCIVFTEFTRSVSSLWMNTFKATIGTFAFLVAAPFLGGLTLVSWPTLLSLLGSGAIGLAIGDLFLLRAFSHIGPGRTLILFAFQPLVLGTASFFLFGQELNAEKFWGLFFFLSCLFIFSLETRRKTGSWDWRGLRWALTGVLLDASGILLTRWAFEQSPEMTIASANVYRGLGCLTVFFFVGRFLRPIGLKEKFLTLSQRRRTLVVFGSLLGTFLSLLLYLTALKSGHLATISGIAITSPLFATLFESLWERKMPTPYLWAALVSFVIGFWIVV